MALTQQQIFALSMFVNVYNSKTELDAIADSLLSGKPVGGAVADALTAAKGTIGDWKVAWGPRILWPFIACYPVNTMYVAQSVDDPTQYVIAIAGTSSSLFDQVEDLDVAKQKKWSDVSPGGAAAGAGAMISGGAATGLGILLAMKPPSNMPGGGSTLLQFLQTIAGAGVKVTVTGHSLGGAMAATVALWLCDNQKLWDASGKVAVSAMTTAGPTAGNSVFAGYSDKILGSSLSRLANPFDVVPHAWDAATLALVPGLYGSAGITEDSVTWFINIVAVVVGAAGQYRQVQASAAPIAGAINKDAAYANFFAQMGYQHNQAYWGPFGYDDSWTGHALTPKAGGSALVIPRGLQYQYALSQLQAK